MEIDPEDDTLDRWVVRHYRYDPERRERRHVTVAAYDSAREQERALDALAAQVRTDIAAGERDDREHVTGCGCRLGYAAAQAAAHRVRRAMEHGADPRRALGEDTLPSNVGIFGWSADGETFSAGGIPARQGPSRPSWWRWRRR